MMDAQMIDALDTPSVLIDLDRMARNITRMQAHCDALGLAFRPHIKTHKIPDIARMQLAAGAVGIACQKVSEADVFAQAGCDDILIPYNIVGARKAARLMDLAIYNRVSVSADSQPTIEGLSAAAKEAGMLLRVLVELESSMQRAGAPVDQAVTLAEKLSADEHLSFAGLLIFPSTPECRPVLQETLDRLDRMGIGCEIVSGGGVEAALHAAEVPELTELRVGTYVFNDWATVRKGAAVLEDCAMMVRTTVVSRPTDDRAIIDAGSKTLSSESLDGLFGYVLEYPDARLYRLSEEHGFLDCSACDRRPAIGDVLHIVPVHTCLVTNLHDTLFGVRGQQIEITWPVAARGKVW